ncbi:MAG: hypothetical protein AB8I08_38945 [Sandaracinaceae bacterium]
MRSATTLLAVLLLACAEPPCPPGDPTEPHAGAGFALVSSDYSSTAIGLLDADGQLLTESFVDSGSVAAGLVAALSGDVVLPTGTTGPCRLTLVDRLNTDVVTTLDLCAGGIVSQLDLGGAFGANPQDVLVLPDGLALVSRYERNERAAPDSLDRGNDVVLVSLSPPEVRARFDLSPLDDGDALARPTRMVRLEAGSQSRVLVGLARLSRNFETVGAGAIGVLDVESGSVEPLVFPGTASCDTVVPVPDSSRRAVVQCSGRIFSTEEQRRDSVGVFLVELTDSGDVDRTAEYRASMNPGRPVYDTGAVALGGTRVLMVAKGDLLADVPDRVGVLDLETNADTPLFEAGSAFVIGSGATDGEQLLLPDAHRGAVRRFTLPELTERGPVVTAACRGLPPREVRRL